MMYWPWDLIGENMQLCLAGLRDVDRSVVNHKSHGHVFVVKVIQYGVNMFIKNNPMKYYL